jgi:cold-inducible RNA-binding protein
MATKLFVGGLPYEMTQDELHKLFSGAGAVFGVKLIMDRETGRSKGFGFVEMASEADAKNALSKLNGHSAGGRKIFITEARPQEEKPAGAEGRPAFAGKPAFTPPPGFVERRSGRDRRKAPGFGAPSGAAAKPAGSERRESFGEKKWAPKPGGFAGKPSFGDRKPFGEKKPWADKKPWGDKKPGGFGGKKSWADKPAGEKKPWAEKKAWGDKPAGGKKPWSGKPASGGKPGGFGGKKPWSKPEGKPGGFSRRVKRGSN